MKASAVFPFAPSGFIGIFVFLERVLVDFTFKDYSLGLFTNFARWTMVICVWGYPIFWSTALVLTVIGLVKDWPAKYLIMLSIFPYVVAAVPLLVPALAPIP